jgi:alcohol dehydrogenase class IV
MKPFNFNTAPRIVFGEGSLARIGEITAAQLGKRVLLVTDPGLIKVGLIEPALMSLEAAGVAVSLFSDVEADPPEHVVMACTKVAQDLKAEGVIGLGGGSSMDVAKLAALLAPGTEKLADAYGVGNAKGPRLPLLLAPTTAGTGSEVTPVSIVTTGASEKKGVVSPVILPDVALLDPATTPSPARSRAKRCGSWARRWSAPSITARTRPRAATCSWAPCWRARLSPTRRSRRSMRWLIRWAAIITSRTASRTR